MIFFRNYSDSKLFEIFLYPYFKKETLLAIGSSILWDLFTILSECCHSIETEVKHFKLYEMPLWERIFIWNDVPGKDDGLLLSHLQQLVNLESIDPYEIKKDDTLEYPKITVNVPTASPIILKLDKERSKVTLMFRTINDEINRTSKKRRLIDAYELKK